MRPEDENDKKTPQTPVFPRKSIFLPSGAEGNCLQGLLACWLACLLVFGCCAAQPFGIMGVWDHRLGPLFGTIGVWDHCLGMGVLDHRCLKPASWALKNAHKFPNTPSYWNDSTLKQSGCDNTEKEEEILPNYKLTTILWVEGGTIATPTPSDKPI